MRLKALVRDTLCDAGPLLPSTQFVSGSDISELLLRGHEILEQSSLGAHRPGVGGDGAPKVAGSPPTEEAEESSPSPDEGIVVAQDRTVLGTGGTQVLAKFREFLLFGHKKVSTRSAQRLLYHCVTLGPTSVLKELWGSAPTPPRPCS